MTLAWMAEGTKITGVIFSDLGRGSSFMALDWVQKRLRESLGFSPYPATLNLKLEAETDLASWQEVQARGAGIDVVPPDSSFCLARCFSVEIEGKVPGAVLRPVVDGYPPDKLELIAPVRLKDELEVRDGDRITLEFLG